MTRNTQAYEMLKCEHCEDLAEPRMRNASYCGDCRDDSRRTVTICGSCDTNEVKDESDTCTECQMAAAEARVDR